MSHVPGNLLVPGQQGQSVTLLCFSHTCLICTTACSPAGLSPSLCTHSHTPHCSGVSLQTADSDGTLCSRPSDAPKPTAPPSMSSRGHMWWAVASLGLSAIALPRSPHWNHHLIMTSPLTPYTSAFTGPLFPGRCSQVSTWGLLLTIPVFVQISPTQKGLSYHPDLKYYTPPPAKKLSHFIP